MGCGERQPGVDLTYEATVILQIVLHVDFLRFLGCNAVLHRRGQGGPGGNGEWRPLCREGGVDGKRDTGHPERVSRHTQAAAVEDRQYRFAVRYRSAGH